MYSDGLLKKEKKKSSKKTRKLYSLCYWKTGKLRIYKRKLHKDMYLCQVYKNTFVIQAEDRVNN